MNRTLTITGEARKGFAPDTYRLHIYYKHFSSDYAQQEIAYEKKGEEILVALRLCHVDPSLLKSRGFRTEAAYETYETAEKAQKRRKVGYYGYQHWILTLPLDHPGIRDLIPSLSLVDLTLDSFYLITNRKPCQEAVLALAVQDAFAQAKVIAQTSGLALRKILSVRHGEPDYVERFSFQNACDSVNPGGIDENPDEEIFSDSVRIVWELED